MGSIDLSPPPEEQTYPKIGDRLDAASLSWAWYNEGWNAVKPWALKTAFDAGDGSVVVDTPEGLSATSQSIPVLPQLVAECEAGRMRDSTDFLEDLNTGRLPSVCFLKATGGRDEHPAELCAALGRAMGPGAVAGARRKRALGKDRGHYHL